MTLVKINVRLSQIRYLSRLASLGDWMDVKCLQCQPTWCLFVLSSCSPLSCYNIIDVLSFKVKLSLSLCNSEHLVESADFAYNSSTDRFNKIYWLQLGPIHCDRVNIVTKWHRARFWFEPFVRRQHLCPIKLVDVWLFSNIKWKAQNAIMRWLF